MRASVGDALFVRSKVTGHRDQVAEVIEVRGSEGQPPYWVRFEDGRETLIAPGPDAVVEPMTRDE